MKKVTTRSPREIRDSLIHQYLDLQIKICACPSVIEASVMHEESLQLLNRIAKISAECASDVSKAEAARVLDDFLTGIPRLVVLDGGRV